MYENEERISVIKGEINALKQLLENTDYKALKHADGVISDEEYAETRELRKSYREKINKYEEVESINKKKIPSKIYEFSNGDIYIGKVVNGKMDGISYRVPTTDGSLIDVTLELSKKTSVDEINNIIKDNASDAIDITKDPIVSSDIIGVNLGCLVDANLTNIITSNEEQLVKLVAWYDNEYGYTCQMLKVAKDMFK